MLNLDRMRIDFRDGLRHLRRRPARTVSVVVTLALAVTTTVVALSFAYALTHKPLPFRESERLRLVARASPDGQILGLSLGDVAVWAPVSRAFSAFAAYNDYDATLYAGTTAMRAPGAYATANLSDVLSVLPAEGRWFSAEEDSVGGAAAAVLVDSLARQLFGDARRAIGGSVRIQDETYSVVGVMPAGFGFPIDAQFWIPAGRQPEYASSSNLDLTGVARLADDMTAADAAREADIVARRLQAVGREGVPHLAVQPLRRLIDERLKRFVLPLLLIAALTLLLALASVVNVFVMSACERAAELRLRRALGGGTFAAERLLLMEAAVVGLLASASAVGAGRYLVSLVPAIVPVRLPAFIDFTPSPLISVLAAVVCAGAAVCGALVAARVGVGSGVRPAGAHGVGNAATGFGTARVMVIAQVTTATVLVATAVWGIGSYQSFRGRPAGLDRSAVLLTYSLSADPRYDDRQLRERFLRRVLSDVENLPRHVAAGVVNRRPMDPFQAEQWARLSAAEPATKLLAATATPGLLAAAGVGLAGGRDFTWSDRERDETTAIVSRSAARRLWGSDEWRGERRLALAPRLEDLDGARPARVVGYADDVLMRGLEEGAEPVVYLTVPPQRWTPWVGHLVIRSTLPEAELLERVRGVVRSLDPSVPVYREERMEAVIESSLWRSRLAAWLLAALGGIGMVVALVGLHAIIGSAVRARMREFGIRSALGATAPAIAALVGRSAGALVVPGVALAVPVVVAIRGALSRMLPLAPGLAWPTVVACLCLAAAFALAIAPLARRAACTSPADLMRER